MRPYPLTTDPRVFDPPPLARSSSSSEGKRVGVHIRAALARVVGVDGLAICRNARRHTHTRRRQPFGAWGEAARPEACAALQVFAPMHKVAICHAKLVARLISLSHSGDEVVSVAGGQVLRALSLTVRTVEHHDR